MVGTFSSGAVTTRVELGPLVVCTSFRNPTLLAKMADTLDEISGGRLILGLGAGYHEREYRAFGYPFDHLISRFDGSSTRYCAWATSTSAADITMSLSPFADRLVDKTQAPHL